MIDIIRDNEPSQANICAPMSTIKYLDAELQREGINRDTPSEVIPQDNFKHTVEHWQGSFWSDKYKFVGISTVRGHIMASIPKHWPDRATSDFVCVTLRFGGLFDYRVIHTRLACSPPGYLHANQVPVKLRENIGGRQQELPCGTTSIHLHVNARSDADISGTYGMGHDNGTFKLWRF